MVGELLSADPAAVGPYRLLGRLGAGGMGQVFLGQSPGGRLVAVKVIRPELAGAPAPVAAAAGSGRPGGRVSRLWVAAATGGTAFALSGSGTSGTAGAGQPQAKITLRQVAASSRPTPTASPVRFRAAYHGEAHPGHARPG